MIPSHSRCGSNCSACHATAMRMGAGRCAIPTPATVVDTTVSANRMKCTNPARPRAGGARRPWVGAAFQGAFPQRCGAGNGSGMVLLLVIAGAPPVCKPKPRHVGRDGGGAARG